MTLSRLLALLAGCVIIKATLSVVWGYREYFPPNFAVDFLRGRESYFWGAYAVAFYAHLASGPTSLVLGLTLMSDRMRRRQPQWHRRLGRVQGACVAGLVAPSGLWMAWYASTPIASAGLATLAAATALAVVQGWRAAVARSFDAHRVWMTRTYVLLCSAVVIRIIGGLARTFAIESTWIDDGASWCSWLVPLTIYEVWRRRDFFVGCSQAGRDPIIHGEQRVSPGADAP